MRIQTRPQLAVTTQIFACLLALGCGEATEPAAPGSTPSALEDDSTVEQVLGDDFVTPPSAVVPPAPGPDPAVCIGASDIAAADAPFGNVAEDGVSLDWALTDFQPQSCGFDSTYGLDAFDDRVTLVVLLASW